MRRLDRTEWGTVFGDAVVATAILDRLLREKRRAGLLKASSSQCRKGSTSGRRLTTILAAQKSGIPVNVGIDKATSDTVMSLASVR